MDNAKAMELGLKEVSGILLASVFKNGGADEAGLKTNDVILSVNNVKTSTTAEFMEQLAKFRPGDLLDIIFIRGQKVMASKATLRNQLNSTDLIASGEHEIFKKLGLELRNPDQYEKAMMASQGVMVVSIKNGSIIANTKMEPGYIITRINNKEVTSVSVLLRQLESLKGKTIILEGFYPKVKGEFPYTFEMPN
ncbi:MAG: PDZ domain-containing protein [Saprospiraceae bacterium]|nr:PDZ domain-containing protein [Saprospiraceae bacterium]